MANLGELIVFLDADSKGFKNAMRDADAETQRFASRTTGTLSKTEKSVASSLAKMAGAAAAALAVSAVTKYAAEWREMSAVIERTAGSHKAAAAVMSSFSDYAIQTGINVAELSRSYNRNSQSLDDLGYSTQEQTKLTVAMNAAIVASGASAQKQRQTLDTLSRSISRGHVSQQEFNQVMRDAPVIIQQLSFELGLSTAELQKMAREGRLAADMLSDSLIKNVEELTQKAAEMPASMSSGMAALRTSVAELAGTADTALGATEGLGGALHNLAAAIKPLDSAGNLKPWAESLTLVKDAAVVLAGVLAGRVVASVGASVAAMAAGRIEAIRYQAALASMAGVSQLAATRMAAMSVAAGAARGALALLGGPAGVAIAAGTAIAYFATKNKEAIPSAEDLRGRVERLNSELTSLTRNQADAKLVEIEKDLADAARAAQIAELRLESLNNQMRGMGAGSKGYDDYLEKIRLQKGRVDDAAQALRDLQKTHDAYAAAASGSQEKVNSSISATTSKINDQITALERARDIWGMSDDAVVLYDLRAEGASLEELEKAREILADINAMESAKKADDDAAQQAAEAERQAEAAQAALETMREQALAIGRTPLQALGDSLAERQEMLETAREAEALTDEEYKERAEQLESDHAAAIKEMRQNVLDFNLTEEEQLEQQHEEKMERLDDALEEELITHEEHYDAMLRAKQEFEDGMAAIEKRRSQTQLAGIKTALGQAATLMNSENRKMFEAGKVAAIASATMDMYSGVQKAWALGPIVGPPLAAMVGAAGIENISAIKSTSLGGGGSAPTGTPNAQGGTGFSEQQQQQAPTQNIHLSGLNPDMLYDGKQIIDIVNREIKDGAKIAGWS